MQRFIVLVLFLGCVFSSEIKVEQLPSPRSLCGEGPHWDIERQSLFYIDIYGPNSTMLRYDYNLNKTFVSTVDNEPLMTFILPIKGTTDQFLIGTTNEAKVIRWDGISSKGEVLRTAFEVEKDDFYKTNRFNDAKADPTGRFLGGTQRFKECDRSSLDLANASLYSFDHEHGVRQLRENIFISNGLTWVNKTNKFYYIDSCTNDVKEFDYDLATGDLSNERIAFRLKETEVAPNHVLDGMTSDTNGNLYIAFYGGNKIMKVDPRNGEVRKEIFFEASKITSVAFGGPNLDILFATTASRDASDPDSAGHIYKITGLDAVGTPGVKVVV